MNGALETTDTDELRQLAIEAWRRAEELESQKEQAVSEKEGLQAKLDLVQSEVETLLARIGELVREIAVARNRDVQQVHTPVNFGSGQPFVLDTTENEGAGYTVNHIGTPTTNQPPTVLQPVMYHRSCNITSSTNKTLRHNCDTVSGHSGGPLYRVVYPSSGPSYRRLLVVHQGSYVTVNRGPKVAHWHANITSSMGALSVGISDPWSWIQ